MDEEAIKTWISHKNRALEKKRFCLREKYYYVEKKLLMLMRVHGFLYTTQKSLWASRRCKSEDLEISVFYLCSILLRSHKLHCCAFFLCFLLRWRKWWYDMIWWCEHDDDDNGLGETLIFTALYTAQRQHWFSEQKARKKICVIPPKWPITVFVEPRMFKENLFWYSLNKPCKEEYIVQNKIKGFSPWICREERHTNTWKGLKL